MDKPRRQVRWRGSRKTLSHELSAVGGVPAQGALFAPPSTEPSGKVPSQGRAGTAESKAAVLNEAINLPAFGVTPEALFGAIMLPAAELPIVVDSTIPPNTIEFRSLNGRFLGEITNIGSDPDEHIPFPEE